MSVGIDFEFLKLLTNSWKGYLYWKFTKLGLTPLEFLLKNFWKFLFNSKIKLFTLYLYNSIFIFYWLSSPFQREYRLQTPFQDETTSQDESPLTQANLRITFFFRKYPIIFFYLIREFFDFEILQKIYKSMSFYQQDKTLAKNY